MTHAAKLGRATCLPSCRSTFIQAVSRLGSSVVCGVSKACASARQYEPKPSSWSV
jgi:hypothetical protein